MSALVEITMLASSRPAADAPAPTVAAWYERKAVVLREIAATSGSVSERDTFKSFADQAHQHAVRLLTVPGEDV